MSYDDYDDDYDHTPMESEADWELQRIRHLGPRPGCERVDPDDSYPGPDEDEDEDDG